MIEQDRYTYRVTWSEEDEEYLGLCAEFPSVSWLADTPEETLHGIRQVIADIVMDLKANNEIIPKPISTKKYSGKFLLRIPPETHRQLAIEAAESGISLNRLVSSRVSQRVLA